MLHEIGICKFTVDLECCGDWCVEASTVSPQEQEDLSLLDRALARAQRARTVYQKKKVRVKNLLTPTVAIWVLL